MATKSTRNVFARGGTGLKVARLGSSTTNDPFSQLVADTNKQLNYLNDQKALKALAEGDPDTFIARYNATKGSRSGDEAALWDGLYKRAVDKIDEMDWANKVKEDPKALESFLGHLQDKLRGAQAGGSDAQNIITSMDGVRKAIQARDENARDQTALAKYVTDQNHEDYARYLIEKLGRTSDPQAWSVIRSQIDTLRARQSTEEQVGRVRARSDVITSYLESGKPAGAAISELQKLALDPKISATEVAAIQTLINQIHDREESKARAGAASAKSSLGIDVPAFQKNLTQYQNARNKVDQILADGGIPSPDDMDALRASASVLSGQYQVAAQTAAQYGETDTASRLTTNSTNIDDHLGTLPSKVDSNILKKAVNLDAAAFQTSVTSNPDPNGRLDARIRRIESLSAVTPSLTTPKAQGAVRAEINKLAVDELKDTSVLANKDDLTPAQRDSLRNIYETYQSYGGTLDVPDLLAAAKTASKESDPTARAKKFAELTGLKLKPMLEIMGQQLGEDNAFVGQTSGKGSDAVDELLKLANASTITQNRQLASDIGRRLIGTPGAIPFGPVGSPEYDMLGLTSMDILEMRRGAGLIKGGRPPLTQTADSGSQKPNNAYLAPSEEDLTSYMSSEEEIRQEMKMQREMQRQMAQENAPSIEESLLAFTPPPQVTPPPSMYDMGGGAQGFGIPGGDTMTSGNPWDQFLDTPTSIDIPSFSIPNLPDPSPFSGWNDFGASIDSGLTSPDIGGGGGDSMFSA